MAEEYQYIAATAKMLLYIEGNAYSGNHIGWTITLHFHLLTLVWVLSYCEISAVFGFGYLLESNLGICSALIPDIPLICMLVAQFRDRLATAHALLRLQSLRATELFSRPNPLPFSSLRVVSFPDPPRGMWAGNETGLRVGQRPEILTLNNLYTQLMITVILN